MKTIRQALRSALRCGAMGGLAVFAVTSHAQETQSRQIALDIEPQSMSDALNDWAQQTGLQLIFPDADITNRLAAPSVRGTYTAQAALNQLLAGTQLTYEFVNDRTVSIRERHPDAPMLAKPMGREQREPYVRLVDRRFGDEPGDAVTVQRVATVEQAEISDAGQRSEREKQRKTDVLAEIVVTGTNIRGLENSTVPITVLDKAYIESTGLSTATRLIESLPQNFALASQSGVSIPGVSGAPAQGSSINLRGIGEGTTLVLVNGRRMALGFVGSAADISALPLSAVERVEVLTDGASAIYGSDAVGGVVNFVLKRDFEGAETRLRSGWADGGVNEFGASQAIGTNWLSGNALMSLEYYKRDLLPASERDFVPSTSVIGSLYPKDESYSVLLSGRQDLTDGLSAFTDALYAKRNSYNEAGQTTFQERSRTDNPQISATLGLDWQASADWRVEASAGYARNEMDLTYSNSSFNAVGGSSLASNHFDIQTARVAADGSLFTLPGGDVGVAVGAEWREETLQFSIAYANGAVVTDSEFDQSVRSAFAEIYVPIVGAGNARTLIDRLEFSLAGRFDDYSSFGSSFDPRFGIMWEPVGGLRLRGSYGSSYVAPKLSDYSLSSNGAFALTRADPNVPSGISNQLRVNGTATDSLSAQESKSLSIGIEFVPSSMPDLQLGLNYYKIDYSDRIATPPLAEVILGNPSSFGSLLIRDPTVEEVNEFIAIGRQGTGFFPLIPNFTPDLVDVIVDRRRRNMSVVSISGLDLSIRYGFAALASDFQVGVNGTYTVELAQQVTPASAEFDTVGTFFNPPDWRARGFMGWQRAAWSANIFVNHSDSYIDNRAVSVVPVGSYTTVDARLAFEFNSGILSGTKLSVSAQNLFDRDPPRTAIVDAFRDMGFDPTNANPMGRLVSIELVKTWGAGISR